MPFAPTIYGTPMSRQYHACHHVHGPIDRYVKLNPINHSHSEYAQL
jgi:hypothetical protein